MKSTKAGPPQAPSSAAGSWQSLLALPAGARDGVRVHLVGVGGSGLSAIAILLLERGFQLSGSDQTANEATGDLARRGVNVNIGHAAGHVAGADLVLISSAVPDDNPEVRAAAAAGIPIVKRAEFLGQLTGAAQSLGIAGTHGKTTTSAMLALVLWRAGLDPSFIVGGRLAEFGLAGSAARAGHGPFIIEADEYDRMFLGLQLQMAIVTNVEWDHVDCYPTAADFSAAFRDFAARLPAGGRLLVCADDQGALALRDVAGAGVEVSTYGLGPRADWQAQHVSANDGGGLDADVAYAGDRVARLSLAVPGIHNVQNALAAIAAAGWFGVPPAQAAGILGEFRGAGRRFELLGEAAGVTVIDDYGHHPTEITATLAAARTRYADRRICAVFQPHTYSRFQALLDRFAQSFGDADQVLVLDIYAARERPEPGVHSRQLIERMDHPAAHYVGSIDAAVAYLLAHVSEGDVVVTLSAGTGNRVGGRLLEELLARDKLPGAGRAQEAVGWEPQESFLEAAGRMGIPVVRGEPLARHTTFRLGGPADLYAAAGDLERLVGLARLAAEHEIPVTVLGGGSNVLVSDDGIRGLVIANQSRGIRTLPNGQVAADAGVALAGLARWVIKEGWTGLEWAVSVPGTVGGAVIGNAGAHGGQIADNLAWVEVAHLDGTRQTLQPEALRLAYRNSLFKEDLAAGRAVPLILGAGFQLHRGDPAQMAAQAEAFLAHRRASQPVEPSAGSVFRNPPGDHAGRLIEASGLKGHRIGAAQISPRHANFIINTGGARASDVVALMALIREQVDAQFHVLLVPEILMLGRFS